MEDSSHSNVSIATRIAFLELLTRGSVPDAASILGLKESSKDNLHRSNAKSVGQNIAALHQSVMMRMQEANMQLQQSIEKYKPIVQFVEDYRSNKSYLLPQISSISTSSSTREGSEGVGVGGVVETITPQSIISILLDAENDVKQLDRDLRSCEQFSQRQVAGAGRLAEYENLQPKLNLLKEEIKQKLQTEEEIEKTALNLMAQYSSHIDTISKLFIHWDSMLTEIEDALTRMERRHS